MRQTFTIFLVLFVNLQMYSQSKENYLKNNRYNVTSDFNFPQNDFKIIGFGAYHGSAKTEQTEMALLRSLTKDGTLKYYLPETDFSIGHYFNEYLKTGDTILLRDLVTYYGIRVPQDKSIETYNKWKEIKQLNDQLPASNKLTVVGIDLLVSYKHTVKHLLEILAAKAHTQNTVQEIVTMIEKDTTDFSPDYDSYAKKVLKNFVVNYEKKPALLTPYIRDTFAFKHIIKNIKRTFEEYDNGQFRENTIYENYTHLSSLYQFTEKPQFVRFGFFHLEKEKEGNNTSFFAKLIENNTYKREEIITVIGFLTKSRVLWDTIYDKQGNYESFTTEGDYGIGDYEKECFLGIENLKKASFSDITLFRLNKDNTPFADGKPDLIEIVMPGEKSNGDLVKGKSTTDFMDYAVLISNSKANTPIEEMGTKKAID